MPFKFNWNYLKWYFQGIHNEYPEYAVDAARHAAEVCSMGIIYVL